MTESLMQFEKYGKTQRLRNMEMIITEKVDGTNGQVWVQPDMSLLVGSKNRVLTPGKQTDNYGFARYVQDNADAFRALGVGHHPGEWWGSGIQRKYNLTGGEKYFSIFNTRRPSDSIPSPILQVPILYIGVLSFDTIQSVMEELWEVGSHLVQDGYFEPEGVCIYVPRIHQVFKETYKNADGKWRAKEKGGIV